MLAEALFILKANGIRTDGVIKVLHGKMHCVAITSSDNKIIMLTINYNICLLTSSQDSAFQDHQCIDL